MNSEGVNIGSKELLFCGKKVLKSEVVFYVHSILLYIVIISCILNLSFNTNNKLNEIWKGILWYSLGRLFPIKNETLGRLPQKNIL